LGVEQAGDYVADRGRATKPNHLTDAMAALQVKLAAEEIASLEEPYVAHPVLFS
jgi:hypothetical protein